MKLRHVIVAGIAVCAVSGIAWGAGMFSTFPIVGQASFCGSTVSGAGGFNSQGTAGGGGQTGQGQASSGSLCAQTIPAGPPEQTGLELIPADTELSGGAPPQTVTIPSSLIGSLNTHVNRLIGGDFATNLWQRGTTPVSAASPTTYVMAADRWFAISANNIMTVSKITPASTAADYLGNLGLNSWMRVARPSGTPSGTSCVGQILDQQASQQLIGNNAVLSFWGYAPTTFSASNYAITVSVAYYTAADSATPGTNTATFALSASGQASGIAGYTAAVAGFSGQTTGTIASGVATIAVSTTPTRYGVYAPIPAANTSGTQVIGVGVSFCATPTLTTSVSTDYFEIEGVQLQGMPSTSANGLAAGVTGYTGFERRHPMVEKDLQLAYSYVYNEPATAATPVGTGVSLTTSTCAMSIPFPVRMREVPSYANALSNATFGIISGAGEVALATPYSATKGVQTANAASLVFTTGTTQTQWDACQLVSVTSGTGQMVFLAEP